jgi:hypothetical protein
MRRLDNAGSAYRSCLDGFGSEDNNGLSRKYLASITSANAF